MSTACHKADTSKQSPMRLRPWNRQRVGESLTYIDSSQR